MGEEETVTYAMKIISRHGLDLALHSWCPAEAQALVYYVHGTQSHAGWLFETGPRLAKCGIALVAMDRRGSGQSGGRRGDIPDFRSWIDDYLVGLQSARSMFPNLPTTMLGQSMGASIAMGLALDERAEFDALLLCTPALNHLHATFDEAQQQKFAAAAQVETMMPIPLKDVSYTSSPAYLDFMRQDTLMLRECSARLMASLYALENHYMAQRDCLKHRRVALVLSAVDPIVANTACRAAFELLSGGKGIIIEMPSTAHYIEFSDVREGLLGLIQSYACTAGFACPE